MLKPLGILGSPFVADPGRLWPLVDTMPRNLRSPIADYLDAGVLLDEDWLGYRDDPLQARPSARSHHAWATDGVYFWIDSGPAYVREYGIGLPEHVIEHCLEGHGDFTSAATHVDQLWDQLSNQILPALASADDSGLIGSEWLEQPAITQVDSSKVQVLGDPWRLSAGLDLMRFLAARPVPESVRSVVATRLRRAPALLESAERSDDVLHPEWTRVAPRTIRTDGRYVWREDYAHYVRMHGVATPDDFVADALTFQPPVLTPDALAQVRQLLDSGELASPERRWMPGAG